MLQRGARSAQWLSAAGGVGALLLPKCPLCFVAYAAALTSLGLDVSGLWHAVRGLVVVTALVSIGIVGLLSYRRRDPVPPALALVGGAVLVGSELGGANAAFQAIGAFALAASAWLNAWRCRGTLGRWNPTKE